MTQTDGQIDETGHAWTRAKRHAKEKAAERLLSRETCRMHTLLYLSGRLVVGAVTLFSWYCMVLGITVRRAERPSRG